MSLSHIMKLCDEFCKTVDPHKNRLALLGCMASGNDELISGAWEDQLAGNAACGLGEILLNAAMALEDFGEKLQKAHRKVLKTEEPSI